MAKITPEYLSKNAYAKYLGINEKAVRKAVIEGKIKNGFCIDSQKIIKHLADEEFGFFHLVDRKKAGVSKGTTISRKKSEPKSELLNGPKSEVRSPKSENFNDSDLLLKPKDFKLLENNSIEIFYPDGSTKNVKTGVKKPPIIKKLNREAEEDEEDLKLDYIPFNPNATEDTVVELLTVTPTMTYKDAILKREILGLIADKIKVRHQQNDLVHKDSVMKTLYAYGSEIKKTLLTIPQRCADELLAADSKVEIINILTKELTDVLNVLSKADQVELKNN